MSWAAVVLIVLWLAAFVAGQIFFKRAMELSARGVDQRKSVSILAAGIASMTVSFFLNLGLLQRFDLSYLYPFQGLSVVVITLTAAVVLKESLSWRLTFGVLLIAAGVMLVSMT